MKHVFLSADSVFVVYALFMAYNFFDIGCDLIIVYIVKTLN